MKTILLTDKEQTEMKRILDGMNELVYTKIDYEGKHDKRISKKVTRDLSKHISRHESNSIKR